VSQRVLQVSFEMNNGRDDRQKARSPNIFINGSQKECVPVSEIAVTALADERVVARTRWLATLRRGTCMLAGQSCIQSEKLLTDSQCRLERIGVTLSRFCELMTIRMRQVGRRCSLERSDCDVLKKQHCNSPTCRNH